MDEKLCIIIEMNGRVYKKQVSKEEFEQLYKPKGWQADREQFKTETEVANYEKMLKTKDKKFDDDLFKKGN